MPLQTTSGAASYDAFGGGVPVVPNYIESVFQTYLYTGNGSTQTITNGIDLAGKGGLVWLKNRTSAVQHGLTDTARGINKILYTNLTSAEGSGTWGVNSFNSTGFGITGTDSINNQTSINYASWTFRKQPKFFDVVTYSGSSSTQNIAHNLGSVPGCIIVKRTSGVEDWFVYHTSLGNTQYIKLNSTSAAASGFAAWNNTSPTSTQFTVLGGRTEVNAAGSDYVAYLFAHDAGGFGLTGTDNVISCGSFTTDGSGKFTANIGYEPQWIMIKLVNGTSNWSVFDNMRGMPVGSPTTRLLPNLSDAESSAFSFIDINATGFAAGTGSGNPYSEGQTFIYIAIRRGPMKVPTSGTSVLGLNARTGTGAVATVTGSAGVSDAVIVKNRGSAVASLFSSRLTGTGYLVTSARDAEVAAGATILQSNPWDVMDGVKVGTTSTITNASGSTFINYLFKRAPSVFDEICYTGNGVAGRTLNHNLGVAPELVIIKSRSLAEFWPVITTALQRVLNLDDLGGGSASVRFYLGNNTIYIAPTSTTLTIATDTSINSSGATYVAYLFATCAGVSKVGSYTGNGSSQTINCGFTGGARFVLIKRTDTDGDWYVWDSARGIVAGNDPHLSLNTTAAEVTTDDSVDTDNTGFIVNQVSATNVNVSSATYIFLAIA